jgi:hypothetical protein
MRAVQTRLPAVALAALALATLIGFFYYPTFPNYDSYYSLLWGREVLHGTLPSFDAYRAPTEHPLAVLFGALLSILGDGGDRVMVFFTLASFVALAAGLYRLGRVLFTPLVGLVAAAILCTRFDFPFLAARAYIDIPYMAFVIWAAVLEVQRPRRGGPVWALLAAAGLLRPEAWLLIGLYFLWMVVPEPSWRRRIGFAALAAIGPFTWVAVDLIATGNPVFSLQHTSGLAEELGRTKGLSQVPGAMQGFFFDLVKAPVVYAGIVGGMLAIYCAPRRMIMPVTLWLIGAGTFVLVGIAGLSVIDRYLLVPSLVVMLLAGVTLAGWTMLEPSSHLYKLWAIGAVCVLVYGAGFTATRVTLKSMDEDLRLRGDSHASLEQVLRNPAVKAGLKCGPLSVPNHKLIPDVRWVIGAGERGVIARSDDRQAKRIQHGVALYVTKRDALLRQALADPKNDDPLDSIPMAGFKRVTTSEHYGVYVRC